MKLFISSVLCRFIRVVITFNKNRIKPFLGQSRLNSFSNNGNLQTNLFKEKNEVIPRRWHRHFLTHMTIFHGWEGPKLMAFLFYHFNPNLYGVFWQPILYRGGKKAPQSNSSIWLPIVIKLSIIILWGINFSNLAKNSWCHSHCLNMTSFLTIALSWRPKMSAISNFTVISLFLNELSSNLA